MRPPSLVAPCLALALLTTLPLPVLLAETVTVFAAGSLSDALQTIARSYEQHTPDRITFSFAASSTLARQIEAGAPADMFFSADVTQMDNLQQGGHLLSASRTNLLGNQLVIVTAADASTTIHGPEDLARPDVTRIALGDPQAVPIGVYARRYLVSLALWDRIAPKVVAMENVRTALAAVAAGNADASIVYKTDATILQNIRVAYAIPPDRAPAILYPVALLRDTTHRGAAQRFLDHLATDHAQSIFRAFGFVAPAPQAVP